MKGSKQMLALMMAMAMTGQEINETYTPVKPKKIIPKGHKKFIIEGIEIYALNQANAVKKFLNLSGNKKGNTYGDK